VKLCEKNTLLPLGRFEPPTVCRRPLVGARISAGFPSPADDFLDRKLDLNELLIHHPSATFFVRVAGSSMTGVGIQAGDILVVDRSLEPADNKIIIAILNGELTVKRICRRHAKLFLLPENPAFQPIEVTPDIQFEVWGVVTSVIHSL
jgi:DNA polymerase V